MSVTDELLKNNESYSTSHGRKPLSIRSAKQLAIVACMDSRMDIFGMLGLQLGEAHVIRNAGGSVTDDVLRSLVMSQRLLGTTEIMLIHHTECGAQMIKDDEFREQIAAEVGFKPPFAMQAFAGPENDLRESLRFLRNSPFLLHRNVRAFVCDTETGKLHEVTL
jgi:carbonic anhydrase